MATAKYDPSSKANAQLTRTITEEIREMMATVEEAPLHEQLGADRLPVILEKARELKATLYALREPDPDRDATDEDDDRDAKDAKVMGITAAQARQIRAAASAVDPMTEIEEALRIAHGTAVVLSMDADLDECVTSTISGIAAQIGRAQDAFEAVHAERRSAKDET